MPSQPDHPTPQIDYAPPTGRPSWLTQRLATIVMLVIAAALAAGVVVPRVWQRAELLKSQKTIMAGATSSREVANIYNAAGGGSSTGGEHHRVFLQQALGQTRSLGSPLFAGARQAGEGMPQRLVVMEVAFHSTTEVTLSWQTIQPATWLSQAQVLAAGVVGPMELPFEASSFLIVRSTLADSRDPARIHLIAEAGARSNPSRARRSETSSQRPVMGMGPVFRFGSGDTSGQRARISAYLMPDDTVRIDWPAPPEE